MSNYTIVLSRKAQKQLDKLTSHIAEPILDAIASLEKNPKPLAIKNWKEEMDIVSEQVTTELSTRFLIPNSLLMLSLSVIEKIFMNKIKDKTILSRPKRFKTSLDSEVGVPINLLS